MQVGASGGQVPCAGQGDSDQPSAPSHVRVARDGVSGTGGALDTPSNRRGGSVGVRYLLFILFHFAARSSAEALLIVVAVDYMSCELEELLYSLLLKVKALASPRELPSCHRALRHLVINRLLTLTVEV